MDPHVAGGGGMVSQGVWYTPQMGHVMRDTLPPPERTWDHGPGMDLAPKIPYPPWTDTCEKHYLPATSLAGGEMFCKNDRYCGPVDLYEH